MWSAGFNVIIRTLSPAFRLEKPGKAMKYLPSVDSQPRNRENYYAICWPQVEQER